MNNEEHMTLVTDCEARESKLTDWERQFVDSVSAQLAKGRSLSETQSTKLNDIWEKVT